MAATNSFTTVQRIARQAGAADQAARQRLGAIEAVIGTSDGRPRDLLEKFKGAAAKAALCGRVVDPKVSAARRDEIVAERDRLRGLEGARPLALEAVREAAVALEAAQRDLGSAAIPELHKRRLQEIGKLGPVLTALLDQLAAVQAVDKMQDHLCGLQPFVRSLPERFFYSEPLVAKLIAAIAPQFPDDPSLPRKIDSKAKELARAEIQRMEKVDG